MVARYMTTEDLAGAAARGDWVLIESQGEHDQTIVAPFPTKEEAEQVRDELNGWVARSSVYSVGQLHPPAPAEEEQADGGR